MKKATFRAVSLALGLSLLVSCGKVPKSDENDSGADWRNPLFPEESQTAEEATSVPETTTAVTSTAPATTTTETLATPVTETLSESEQTLVIYCWNDELQDLLEDTYPDYAGNDRLADGTKIEWHVLSTALDEYQTELDLALQNQMTSDMKVDLFLIEPAYAKKYIDSDASMDVAELGFTEADLQNQYSFTHQLATDSNGVLKALTWQATPGLFCYRRSIAKEVLGTDDPDKVQEQLANWDLFDGTAEKMQKSGYYMLASYDESYRVFAAGASSAWVTDNNEIQVDSALKSWANQAKSYLEKGSTVNTTQWSNPWAAGMGTGNNLYLQQYTHSASDEKLMNQTAGKVFGYFTATWGIAFTMPQYAADSLDGTDGTYGDWAVCAGPESYNWGSSYLVCANGSDNTEQVANIMKALTCDATIMERIQTQKQDFVNNTDVIQKLAAEESGNDFLGGQKYLSLLHQCAMNINTENATAYDTELDTLFKNAMQDYMTGKIKYTDALDNFYEQAIQTFPTLTRPKS